MQIQIIIRNKFTHLALFVDIFYFYNTIIKIVNTNTNINADKLLIIYYIRLTTLHISKSIVEREEIGLHVYV